MQYIAKISWQRNDLPFNPKSYDRTHSVQFGGGSEIKASSAPEYLGKAELVNPEELFTASISSCFMLTFLYLAATKNLIVNEYRDAAKGKLAKNGDGKMAVTEVVLSPSIKFENEPSEELLKDLFQKAHDSCFISSSVKTTVTVERAI